MKKPTSLIVCWAVLSGLVLVPAPEAMAQAARKPAAAAPARDATDLYNRAQQMLQTGEFEAAIGAFQQLLDLGKDLKDPRSQQSLEAIYYGLGAAYFNSKKYTEAVAALAEVLKRFPQSRLVPEIQFFISQANFSLGDYQKALDGFKIVEANPRYREEALLMQAQASRKLNKPSDAVGPLQKLVGADIRSSSGARGALDLALVYGEQGNATKAVETLNLLAFRLRFLPNVAAFNQACVIVGDALLANGKQDEALSCYRLMRPKADLLQLQQRQITSLERQVELLRRRASRETPDRAAETQSEAARIAGLVEETKKLQEQFEKAPDTTPGIFLRTAKALYDLDRKWEAVVAYDELLLRYPEAPERESAVFGMLATYPEIRQFSRAQELCDQFLKEFPQSERIEEVRYLKGVISLEAEDPVAAIKIFSELLKEKPDTKYKEEVAYMIANAKFAMGEFERARSDYQTYVKTFPQGERTAEVTYRAVLCLVFGGQYEKAIGELDDFITRNPQSPFLEDAMYRKMVCYFAAAVNDRTGKLYHKIIDYTAEFEKGFPESRLLGEVYALRGDAWAGLDKDEEAGEAYLEGYRKAKDDETLNYNLFEAVKTWQKHGQWGKVDAALQEFIKTNPEHPSTPTAKYWIGRALVKQRKVEEAKQFYALEIRRYMTQPRRDAVEMMIRELVQVLAKRRRPVAAASVAVVAAGAPAPDRNAQTTVAQPVAVPADAVAAPEPPLLSPEEELDQMIGGEETLKNRTATARLFLARAMLAKAKLDETTHDTYFDQLADFEATDLSAYILGQLAEYLVDKAEAAHRKGDEAARNAALDQAERFAKGLLSSFPKSEFVELAYIGLGEVAHARGNWQVSYQWFKDAIDVAGAVYKTKEAVFGQARELMELGRLPEAKKLFEQVASTREWRGEVTAQSIFNLGEIEFRQQKWNEAIAYYQRAYVSYQKYVVPVAKSYLQSARAFDKLGRRPEAGRTLTEMLRNEKLPQSYRDEGRKLLKELGFD